MWTIVLQLWFVNVLVVLFGRYRRHLASRPWAKVRTGTRQPWIKNPQTLWIKSKRNSPVWKQRKTNHSSRKSPRAQWILNRLCSLKRVEKVVERVVERAQWRIRKTGRKSWSNRHPPPNHGQNLRSSQNPLLQRLSPLLPSHHQPPRHHQPKYQDARKVFSLFLFWMQFYKPLSW